MREVVVVYLAIVNVAAFAVYAVDALVLRHHSQKLPLWIMLALPLVGGSLGACAGNYGFNTSWRRSRHADVTVLRYVPGCAAIVHLVLLAYLGWGNPAALFHDLGGVGSYVLIASAVGVVLVLAKVLDHSFRPANGFESTFGPLIVAVVAGGAPGVLAGKLLFNYKYSWPGSAGRRVRIFFLNAGAFVFAALWLLAAGAFA